MRRVRTGAIVVAAIFVPIALGLTAFVISRTSTATQIPPVPGIVFQDQGPRSSPGTSAAKSPRPSSPGVQSTPTVGDDHGGRCSEPEHENDPSCSGGGSGSSGPGSGGSGSSGSDSSGSGSGGSGGSGDD